MGHSGYLNTVTMSPDGSLCASGGKDGKAMLWDLNDGKHLYTLENQDPINSLCFSPNRYWLCAASGPYINVWILSPRIWLLKLSPMFPAPPRLILLSVCPWPGPLTARPCSPATATT